MRWEFKCFEIKKGWHKWFAWYPVQIVEGKWVWLSRIWRFFECSYADSYWVHSNRPDFNGGQVWAHTLDERGESVYRP